MKVTDLPKLLTGFRYNSFPKEYSNLNEALDALKLFISENWEKLHADIIKSIAELNKKENHIDFELYLFDCLRFPVTAPIIRYKDGLLQEDEIAQFPFNQYSYHDSEINLCSINDDKLIINLDLIEKWENDDKNGWNQIGNNYNIIFTNFTVQEKKDSQKYIGISNNEIEAIKDCTILSFFEVPLIDYYKKRYCISEKTNNKRLFVLETLFKDYSEFVIIASNEVKEKLTDNNHLISYAISVKK